MKNKCLALLCVLLPSLSFAAPAVVEVKTPGGLTAWLVEEHSQPLFAMHLTFENAGSTTDPKEKEGRAQLAASLLQEGAGERDALALNTLLEEHAIRVSTGVDADSFSLTLKALSEERGLAFSVLADLIARPRFDRDALERVRARTRSALKEASQNPEWLLSRASAETLFAGHPYARPAEGTDASLQRITRGDLLAFARSHLTRGNLIISVSGDITPDQLSALLDEHLLALPAAAGRSTAIAEAALPEKAVQKHVDLDIPQTLVRMALPGIKRDDPDYITAYVVNYILGDGSLNSRLGREIREKRGLAYGVSAALEPMRHAGLLSLDFATRRAQAQDAITVATDTLNSLRTEGVSTAELEDAKHYLTGSFVMRLDSNAELAALLAIMQRYRLGRDYLETRNAQINAVTQADANRVASRLLSTERMAIFTVGKEEQPDATP